MMERWELPKGWEWKQLKTLAPVHYGKGLSEKQRRGGNVPVYGANGVVGFHDVSMTKGQTIVIGRKGSAGAVNWSEIACWPIDTTFFIDEFPKILYPKFLYKFLRSQQIDRLQQSAAIPGLNRDVLYSIEVPIPYPNDPDRSLAEQRRIVARLELLLGETRAMREDIQAMRRDLAQVMESVLAEVFPNPNEEMPEGWERKNMSEVSVVNPARPRIQRNDNEPTSFVPMQAVDEFEGKISQIQIKPYGQVKRGYTYFEENDILLAKITPSMENGKVAIARGLLDRIGFGTTEFHILRPNPDVLPEWIFYYIRRKAFREEAKNNFRGAVGQQRVPEEFLVYYPIPIPYPDDPARSLAEQRRIVAYLEHIAEEIRAMDDVLAQDLRDIEVLEQSILTAAFRGEV